MKTNHIVKINLHNLREKIRDIFMHFVETFFITNLARLFLL